MKAEAIMLKTNIGSITAGINFLSNAAPLSTSS
jgi:hypothetical protein